MTFILGRRSLTRLEQVHPDLQLVVKRAITLSTLDFTVLEGARSVERQRELVAAGASKTMKSRHLVTSDGWAHAVDLGALVAGKIRWDWPLYRKLADAMNQAADDLSINIIWGGDWDDDGDESDEHGLRDGPHFQLPHRNYPD